MHEHYAALLSEYSLLAYLQRYPDIDAYEEGKHDEAKEILLVESNVSKIHVAIVYPQL